MANNKDSKKTLKVKSSSKELEQFERVKLEETKVIKNLGTINTDKILLDELKLQLKSATDKKAISELKNEIKILEKKIAKKNK